PSPTPAPPESEDPSPPPAAHEIETLRVQTQYLDAVLRSADSLFEMNSDQDRATRELDRLFGQIRDLQRQCESTSTLSAPLLRRLTAMPEFAGISRHVEAVTQQMRRIVRQHRAARGEQQ